MQQNKELCRCGKMATWAYLPSSSSFATDYFFCDDCVPRGCECNNDYKGIGGESMEDFLNQTKDVTGKYFNELGETSSPNEATHFVPLDDKGRGFPCCEYDYDEDGYDKE